MARRFVTAGASAITGAGLGLLLAIGGLQAGAAKPDLGSAAARGVVRVADFGAHIYSSPDPFATFIQTAPFNSSYYVVSQIPGWRQVLLAQGTGWIPVSRVLLSPVKRESYFLGVHSRRVFYGALCGSLVGSALGLVAGWTAINSIFKVDWQVYGPVQGNRGVSATTLELSSCTSLFGLALAPGGAALGAWSAGEPERPGGSLARAWLMADISWLCFTGIGLGLDAFVSAYATNGNFVPVFTPAGSVLGMALGAAWAYEASQPQSGPPGFLTEHLLPPAVGFCMTGRNHAQSHAGLNARLLSLQF